MQPLVVCGPSGVGKGTIISRFMEGNNSRQCTTDSFLPKFVFSVSHTTRKPRVGEVDGVHYHFVSMEFMQDKIDKGGFFIEHALVHGNLYGTSFQSIFDASAGVNQQCLLDIDVEGVRSLKNFQHAQQRQRRRRQNMRSTDHLQGRLQGATLHQSLPDLQAKFIFITPPSIDILEERLRGRKSETAETLRRRLKNAKAEIEYGVMTGNFDAIIVNDDLEMACQEFEKMVNSIYATSYTVMEDRLRK